MRGLMYLNVLLLDTFKTLHFIGGGGFCFMIWLAFLSCEFVGLETYLADA